MIEISTPTTHDIPALIALAHTTWHATYPDIISREQIDFMLNLFYSPEGMASEMRDPKHRFYLAKENGQLLGYAHCHADTDALKLSKLYILPGQQGKGVGKLLLAQIESDMKARGEQLLRLNVNRSNPAYQFYLKMGFSVTEEVDIPLDRFWLNDYVMEKTIA